MLLSAISTDPIAGFVQGLNGFASRVEGHGVVQQLRIKRDDRKLPVVAGAP